MFAFASNRIAATFAACLTASLVSACSAEVTTHPAVAADSQRGMGEHVAQVGGTNFMIRSGLNQQFCFDAKGDRAADGTQVQLYSCAGREQQRWTFVDQPGGEMIITGIGGLCLDVRGRKAGDGTPLQLWQCANAPNQKFRHENDGRIREVGTGKCLTVSNLANGAALAIDECDRNNGGQVWVVSH